MPSISFQRQKKNILRNDPQRSITINGYKSICWRSRAITAGFVASLSAVAPLYQMQSVSPQSSQPSDQHMQPLGHRRMSLTMSCKSTRAWCANKVSTTATWPARDAFINAEYPPYTATRMLNYALKAIQTTLQLNVWVQSTMFHLKGKYTLTLFCVLTCAWFCSSVLTTETWPRCDAHINALWSAYIDKQRSVSSISTLI